MVETIMITKESDERTRQAAGREVANNARDQ
jgi:hypothetical protein